MRPHSIRRRQHLPKLFPLSRKFSRIVSDIFVSQAIVHMQNSAIAKLDTSQNLTSFLSIKLPTRLIRPISPHLQSIQWHCRYFPSTHSCPPVGRQMSRRVVLATTPKISPGKGKLCIRVPPPDHRIGRPHVFLNLTSLELPAAALGGIRQHKNCHFLGIVDILEFQNATILLHQEDKEDTNRLVSILPKIYDVKKSMMLKTLQQARLLNSRKSGSPELQKSYAKFGGGTIEGRNGGTEPAGGVPQSRLLHYTTISLLRAIFSRSSLIQQPGHIIDTLSITIFPIYQNTQVVLLGSPNLIFLQIRFIIILQKMRNRKLKRLSEPKNFYSRQLVKSGLSKVDFSKFLCYNIYRKMKEIKSNLSRSKVKLNYPKNNDNQP